MSLKWQGNGLGGLERGLDEHLARIEGAVRDLAEFLKEKLESEAQESAPWQDVTGEARRKLHSEVTNDAARHVVTIWLAHGVDYGRFLELGRGGRFAIIMPTIEANAGEIERLLLGIFK